MDVHLLRRIWYKVQDLISSPPPAVPEAQRTVTALPDAGRRISLETALNSRCCSDADGNPRKFHWGMFDTASRLPPGTIEEIVARVKAIPALQNSHSDIQVVNNELTFLIDNVTVPNERERAMVESGMQQQAVGLLCAALGAGMVFAGLGDEGAATSGGRWATIRIRLGSMKASYEGDYWTTQAPSGSRPWLPGSLPEPRRRGSVELLSVLERLAFSSSSGAAPGVPEISQLLWAARGRTPHFFKSEPWGMTIPVSRGDQNVSSLYLALDGGLSRYVNWRNNRPTHSLEPLSGQDRGPLAEMQRLFPGCQTIILLAINDTKARAFWEVGYQLLNLQAQATVLDLAYETVLLDSDQKACLRQIGIPSPIAGFLLRNKLS